MKKQTNFRTVAITSLVIALAISLNLLLGIIPTAFAQDKTITSMRLTGEELAEQIEEEGIVLVKNDNCLPLSEGDVKVASEHRLNVFGWSSIDWIGGGSGSGRCVQSVNNLKPKTGLLDALHNYKVFDEKGLETNPDLQNFYTEFCNGRAPAARDTLNSHDYESCVLYEPAMEAYSEQLLADAKEYTTVALAVVGRISGESNDAPKVQYKYNAADDHTRTYLDISVEEENLLKYLGENYQKVVVIVNSTNAVNLEFLDRIPGLSACLVVGGTGNNAVNAVPSVLFGKKSVKTDDGGSKILSVSPSGRLTDTYTYDFKSNPNFAYCGIDGVSFYKDAPTTAYPLNVTNLNVGKANEKYPGVGYLDYVEGIYVGYKWYETADKEGFFDSVKNQYGQGYDGVVQYPFGYGLSYSQFEWNVKKWSVGKNKITVKVEVKNIGDFPAKEVVELYYTPPYYAQSNLEKAHVNLCAFAKTATDVAPGESRLLTLSVELQDMASYDTSRDNGKFVLEKGAYELTLRENAHTVKDTKNASFRYNVKSDILFDSYSGTNGSEKIHNLFSGDNLQNQIAADGSDTETGLSSAWLSRKDFQGTFLSQKQTARSWNSALNQTNTYSAAAANQFDAQWEATFDNAVSYGASSDMLLFEKGSFTDFAYFFGNSENYDGLEWELLLDQLTEKEINSLVLHGYLHEEPIASVGKPKTVSIDGPAQVGSFYQSPVCTGYPCATVLAQTWNQDLFESFGQSAAKEAKATGRDGWYAPGANLHRSAFGGRNYEYYSEDPYLSGMACGLTVKGALDCGVYSYIKHFIGYDQESYRDGLYCWMTEQTLRETYLAPFKRAIDMGATALMSSYGRIGATWSGGNRQLLTELLRDEWGFLGTVVTDYTDHKEYMNGDQMIRAGGDLWMDGSNNNGSMLCSTTSSAYRVLARNAAKHVLYTWANAAYREHIFDQTENVVTEHTGEDADTTWVWIVVPVAVVLAGGGAAAAIVITKRKKSK